MTPRRGATITMLLLGIAAAVLLLLQSPAAAHPADATLVKVATNDGRVTLDVQIPLHLFDQATGMRLGDRPAEAVTAQASAIRAVVARSVSLTGASGSPWTVSTDRVDITDIGGVPQLHLMLTASPTNGDRPESFTLRYTLVVEQLAGHDVYVAGGADTDGGEVLGVLDQRHTTVTITLDRPATVGLRSMIDRGIEHVRTGGDHIVFIMLLAASTVVSYPGTRARLTALATRSTAFTVGHAISLGLAAAAVIRPPSRLVETAIAVTVLLTAVHLARPCIPHRAETAIALAFGLVHGFGFAGTLDQLGLHGRALVVPTIGFNVGLELAQLAADVVLSVPLWWLARRRGWNVAVAVPAGLVATSWIAQRAIGASNPLEPLIDALTASPERLAEVLLALAATTAIVSGGRRTAQCGYGGLPGS